MFTKPDSHRKVGRKEIDYHFLTDFHPIRHEPSYLILHLRRQMAAIQRRLHIVLG